MTDTCLRAAPRRALIVHAHPEPASFSSAQANAVEEQLHRDGLEVQRIDLYADGWDPVLHRDQFGTSGYFKPQAEQRDAVIGRTLGNPVQAHLDLLLRADLLVLSFPLWWFSMPAILKGWIDRVFVMGAAFGGEHGVFADGGLRGKQAMLLLTTGGGEPAFSPGAAEGYGDMQTFLFHIHRGMLEFVGYDVLPPVITYGPARLEPAERDDALRRVRAQASASAVPTR
ncbi:MULTISPECIES: NAD(P)H-dependent oxidoreductase [unclassified Rathayibacter]|uniref:NAD(P)H-dependent oxidoreductase n=1 Tax=unclassified Rathayibacter TaxID=2609250 RepID=UPI0006FACA11|nr:MULTISPECIES: NAD(P)H-dependent oxidoreductase [unclassified Rathayibacter]KQQ03377.1 NAD(P)H dehydrogenase [Rathayibacter sp. Leaf294]KQS11832.1 NAD(P)H dehydrogenase [Rathayibacter sp. Leaf185]